MFYEYAKRKYIVEKSVAPDIVVANIREDSPLKPMLESEQHAIFGISGSLLEELHTNALRLVAAVGRMDREAANRQLQLLAEDVTTMQAGLDAHFK